MVIASKCQMSIITMHLRFQESEAIIVKTVCQPPPPIPSLNFIINQCMFNFFNWHLKYIAI